MQTNMAKKKKAKLNMKDDKSERVKILRADYYEKHHVVIRMIGNDFFEYITSHDGQVYSGYNIITPRENETELSEQEIADCRDLTMAMAETTIDALMGVEVDEQTKHYAKTFEKGRKQVEKAKK